MTSSRHLIDDKVWERIMFAAKAHGYKLKGKKSWQKFVLELVEKSLIPEDRIGYLKHSISHCQTTSIEIEPLKERSGISWPRGTPVYLRRFSPHS